MLASSGFPILNGVYSINSSKTIGNFPAIVLNFNQLFLKLNRFICNWLPVLPDHWSSSLLPVSFNDEEGIIYLMGDDLLLRFAWHLEPPNLPFGQCLLNHVMVKYFLYQSKKRWTPSLGCRDFFEACPLIFTTALASWNNTLVISIKLEWIKCCPHCLKHEVRSHRIIGIGKIKFHIYNFMVALSCPCERLMSKKHITQNIPKWVKMMSSMY